MTNAQYRQALALFRYGLIAEFIQLPAGTRGFDLHDHNACALGHVRRRSPETCRQIYHRNDRAAQIDDSADARRHHWHRCQAVILDNLLDREVANRKHFAPPNMKVRYCSACWEAACAAIAAPLLTASARADVFMSAFLRTFRIRFRRAVPPPIARCCRRL